MHDVAVNDLIHLELVCASSVRVKDHPPACKVLRRYRCPLPFTDRTGTRRRLSGHLGLQAKESQGFGVASLNHATPLFRPGIVRGLLWVRKDAFAKINFVSFNILPPSVLDALLLVDNVAGFCDIEVSEDPLDWLVIYIQKEVCLDGGKTNNGTIEDGCLELQASLAVPTSLEENWMEVPWLRSLHAKLPGAPVRKDFLHRAIGPWFES